MLETPDLSNVDEQLDGVDNVTHIIHDAWLVCGDDMGCVAG